MERKRVIIKKESKIKKNEENRTEFSNAGLIRTTKSEIFSELSLIETEILTDRASVDGENGSAKRMNGGSTQTKRCLEIPKIRITQKDGSIKPATLDNFDQMKEGGNFMDNKPFIRIDDPKDVNLNEVSSSSERFMVNTTENYDTGEDAIIDAKHVGCNTLNKSNSNAKKVFEKSISEKSPINNQENEISQGIKLAPDGEIIVHNTSNIPTQINCKGALNLGSAGKASNVKTDCNNLSLLSPNADTKKSKHAIITLSQNKNINKRKALKDNNFSKKVDIYEHGDNNMILSEGKGKNNKAGVYKGKDKFNKSVTYLVNYFENMKNSGPKKKNLESAVYCSQTGKLSETTKRQKRKLTDDQSFPNKKTPSHDALNVCHRNFNAEDCDRKRHFVSKNIGLLKKANEAVQSYTCKTTPNFNFNDDSSEFCVVKCRQTQIGAKTLKKPPRQPRESSFPFLHMKQSNLVSGTPTSFFKGSPDLHKHARENVCQPNTLSDKSKETEEKNVINDSSAVVNENVSIGQPKNIQPKSLSDKTVYQHKKFNKSNIDEIKSQKSNLYLEKKICMNNPFHLRRHIKAGMSKIKEPTYKDERGKSLEGEESSFAKCFSSLIFFMVIFAFGSYYQFFK